MNKFELFFIDKDGGMTHYGFHNSISDVVDEINLALGDLEPDDHRTGRWGYKTIPVKLECLDETDRTEISDEEKELVSADLSPAEEMKLQGGQIAVQSENEAGDRDEKE